MKYGFFESRITNISSGMTIPFLSNPSVNNNLDIDSIIDSRTFMLKANKTYNIHGGIYSPTPSSGRFTATFKIFKKSNNSEITEFIKEKSYINNVSGYWSINNMPNFHYSPTEDVYLKLFVDSNRIKGGGGNLYTVCSITEIYDNTINIENQYIAKNFDLVGYSQTEVLTEKRWIDGKPIYRIVLGDYIWVKDDINVPYNVNIETLIYKTFLINGVEDSSNSYYVSDSKENRVIYTQSTKSFTIYNNDNSSIIAGSRFKLIVEYTKIEDNSLSPIRTLTINDILPAKTGNEDRLLYLNNSGILEWYKEKQYFLEKTNSNPISISGLSYIVELNEIMSGVSSEMNQGNGFLIPENGIYDFECIFKSTSPLQSNINEIEIIINVNSISKYTLWNDVSNTGNNKGVIASKKMLLTKNDVITILISIRAINNTQNVLQLPRHSIAATRLKI